MRPTGPPSPPGETPMLGRPRGVAQLGSAPALGAGGRGFKSRHPDAWGAGHVARHPDTAHDVSRLVGRYGVLRAREAPDPRCLYSRSTAAVKSTIEELGPTRVRMAIEVPWGDLDHAFGEVYKELGKQVRVPGFRPGKVPNRVLDQRIGRPVILEQVIQHAIPEVYSEVVRDNQVRVLGQPDIEVTRLDDNDALAFTAEVDVAPQLELPALDDLAVTAGVRVPPGLEAAPPARPPRPRRDRRVPRGGNRPAGLGHAGALRHAPGR